MGDAGISPTVLSGGGLSVVVVVVVVVDVVVGVGYTQYFSSLASLQSGWRSQRHNLGMQIPLSHLKSFSEHWRWSQFVSSEPSRHSAFPSHTHRLGMQPFPSWHRNLSGPHLGRSSQLSSSVPSVVFVWWR